jgi:trigger factor
MQKFAQPRIALAKCKTVSSLRARFPQTDLGAFHSPSLPAFPLRMNISIEHQPNCRSIAHIRVPGDEVKKQRQGVVTYYANNVAIPGFRKGKVPASAVTKRFGQEIKSELEERLVNQGISQAIRNEGLDVLRVLAVSDKAHHDVDDSFSFSAELSLAPKFELPEYKGITVKLPTTEVAEADIEQEITQLRERYAEYNDVERAAAMGDCVVLSYTGSVEGKPLKEFDATAPAHLCQLTENWFLLAEEDDFITGFYAALIGIQKDEQREIHLPLPEDFSHEPLRGKTLTMNIACGGVKDKTLPEIDEDLLTRIGGEGFTAERLKEEVKNVIRRRLEQAREVAHGNQIVEHLTTSLEFDLPQEIVNREAQRRTNDIAVNALKQGLPEHSLLEQQDNILNAATQQAKHTVKVSFILSEIAKKEHITVTEQQMLQALNSIASRQRRPIRKVISEAQKSGLMSGIQEDLLLQNALQFLKDHAKVEEAATA